MAEKTNGKIVDRNQEKVSIGMRYGALEVVGENAGEDRRWICRQCSRFSVSVRTATYK